MSVSSELVKQGAAPTVLLDIATRFTDGPIPAENVVGEIEGAVHPEQVVVLGAHLDSWDLSQGATGDGTGVAALLAAAHKYMTPVFVPRGPSASCCSPEKSRAYWVPGLM